MSDAYPEPLQKTDTPRLAKLQPGADWHEERADIQEVVDARLASLQTLLVIEDGIRRAKTENELQHLITNETRKYSGARQIFLLKRKYSGAFKVVCVSSMAITDRDTPLIRWVEQIVQNLPCEDAKNGPIDFELPGFADTEAHETRHYPFRYICWQPLKLPDDTVFAGMLLARNSPWNASSIDMLEREAEFYAHAWKALRRPEMLKPERKGSREIKLAIALSSLLLLFAPIPLKTMAPAEIIAQDPYIVAAPMDGVVDEILIDPNQPVHRNQPLLKFVDTKLRNRLKLAEREMRVAKAVHARATQAAFFSEDARHQLAISKAEYELKRSEYRYALEEYDNIIVRAPRSGLVIFSNKDDWKGRPVATGQQIMHIADPNNVAVSLDLPVADAIVIKKGALTQLFLDAEPLRAVSATISETSYHAVPSSGDKLAYKLRANLNESGNGLPRIGARGTAQIYGDKVTLAFYLFRRPFSWLRQHLGI